MYAQAAIKRNIIPRNGAYRIVNRDVHFCTPPCSSLRSKKHTSLGRITLDTATDPACGTAGFLISSAEYIRNHYEDTMTPEQWERFAGETFTGLDTDTTTLHSKGRSMPRASTTT